MRVLVCGGRGTDNMVQQASKVGVEVVDLREVKDYDI